MAADVPPFELDVQTEGDRTRFVPRGELDLATAPELESAVLSAIGDGRDVVLDLTGLTFMDSTGVRTIVSAHAAAEGSAGAFAVVRPPAGSPVARVIEISGIAEALGLADPA